MPDIRKCVIYGCTSNSRDNVDLKFFNFPTRDSPVYQTWFTLCQESAEALNVVRRPYICSNHFHPWHVGFRRLARGAVPQLKLKAPPGFEERQKAKKEAEEAALKEKYRLLKLTNEVVFEYVKRAQQHEQNGGSLCTTRRALIETGKKTRELLGGTLQFNIDDYWLKKFRKLYLAEWEPLSNSSSNEESEKPSLDLEEIIKSIDPIVKIFSKTEIAEMHEEERKKNILNPNPRKRSFKEAIQEYYENDAKHDSTFSQTGETNLKIVKVESADFGTDQDDGCFDMNSVDSGNDYRVMSEPIVETYEHALEHLRPLEDFALREENYRVIGLLSTLEQIFKNYRNNT